MSNYVIPNQVRIGHIHLKVSDLKRALSFYHDLLGFEVTMMYGRQAAFLSAGGYHHHIGLNTWPLEGVGLSPTAIASPPRRDLALILKRLLEAGYPITGASDHGVSEAIYMNDPDGNGVELYWDKPKDEWPVEADGSLNMFTRALDVEDLLREADKETGD